jgi:hypothetical protein
MGDRGEDTAACLRLGISWPHPLNVEQYSGKYSISGTIATPSLPVVGVDEEIVNKLQVIGGREELVYKGESILIIAAPNSGKSTSANIYGFYDYDELYSSLVGWPDGNWFLDPHQTKVVEDAQVRIMDTMMSLGVTIIGMPTMPAILKAIASYPDRVFQTDVTWQQVLTKSLGRVRRPNYRDRDALKDTFAAISKLNLPVYQLGKDLTPISVSDRKAILIKPGRTMLYPTRDDFKRRDLDNTFPAILVNGITGQPPDLEPMPPIQVHDGQRKVYIGMLYFLSLHAKFGDIVCIAGSAPGTYIAEIARMFSDVKFLCFDPNPTLVKSRRHNVDVRVSEYVPTIQCDLFINDIRRDDFEESDVEADNEANLFYLKSNGARAAWLKYRPSGSGDAYQTRMIGDIIAQSWAREDSGEARILWTKRLGLKLIPQHVQSHWGMMREFNQKRPAIDIQGESAAYSAYMSSLFYKTDTIMVSCFAYCGVQNGDTYENLKESGNLMFNFPNVHVARRWEDGDDGIWFWTRYCVFAIKLGNRTVYVKWRYGTYVFVKPDRSKDIVLSVSTRSNRVDLFGYWISQTTIVPRRDTKRRDWAYAGKEGKGLDILYSSGPRNARIPVGEKVLYNFIIKEATGNIWLDYCLDPGLVGRLGYRIKWLPELAIEHEAASYVDMTHAVAHLWVCGVKGSKFEWDAFQTKENTQTTFSAKGAYSMIRSQRGMSQDTGNTMRYVIPQTIYGNRFISTGPGKVTGLLDGKIGLSVSGHMLGIFAMYGSVDPYEWFRHLKTTFLVQDGRHPLRKEIQAARNNHKLTEESRLFPFELHHGVEDEDITVFVAIAQHYVFDLPIPIFFLMDVFRYIQKLRGNRRLSEGQVGKDFRRSSRPTASVDWKPLV